MAIMKTINRILCSAGLVAMAFNFASCDIKVDVNLTQPTPSAFDESVVFSNYTLAEYNIFGIYQCLGETNSHRGRYLPWYGFNTDIECYGSTNYDGRNLDWAAYDCSPVNSNMNLDNGPYSKIMEGLERANVVIRGLRKYMTDDMKPLLGEALVARAFLYTELIKAYGEVPARFEPVTTETAYINKAERDDLYEQLLADLEEAIGLLDGVVPAKTDRVGKVFAEGLYARLGLMASGYSLRPEDGKTGTGDAGTIRLSTRKELSKETLYPKILGYLQDAIRKGGFSLYSDYEQLWRDFNNMDLTYGKEIIFSIPFSDSRGRWNYTYAVRSEAGGMYPDTRGGSVGPTPFLYYKYKEGDQRRDVSCVNWKWDNTSRQIPAGEMNWYFGKFRFEWMERVPYTGGNDDGIKPVYMRYSDILLMAAEVANELGGQHAAEASEYFREVRIRAFKGDKFTAMEGINTSDKAAFFQAIKDERALEFVGEMLRKQDLIRWNELSSSLDKAKAEIRRMATLEGEYSSHGPALWYKYGSKGEFTMFGLQPGELCDKDTFVGVEGWELASAEYFKENDSVNKRIESLVKAGIDPDYHMWWPIPKTVIDNAQGYLKNDYGYDK